MPGCGVRNCPASAKTALQMGRSCALLTGLNWKRFDVIIDKIVFNQFHHFCISFSRLSFLVFVFATNKLLIKIL